jgi:hypothetical protein
VPRRRASHRNTTVSTAPATTAATLASGPNSPPLSATDPDVTPSSKPFGALVPDTSVPKIAASAKFHPKCRPIGTHRFRVAA